MQPATLRDAAQMGAALIRNTNIAEQYKELANRLNSAASSPSSNQGPQIKRILGGLRSTLGNWSTSLSPQQRLAWTLLGLDDVVGSKAVARLDAAFQEHLGDPAASAAAVLDMAREAQDVAAQCDRIAANARNLLGPRDDEAAPALRIVCTRGANVRTLQELENRAGEWNLILTTFGDLGGGTTESPRIRELERGSVTLEVLMDPATLQLLGQVVDAVCKALTLLTNYVSLKKQLASANLSTADVQKKIEEGTAKAQDEGLKSLAEAVSTSTPESDARASTVIGKITMFLRDGGEIHYLPGPDHTDQQTAARFANIAENLHRLRDASKDSSKARLPEHGTPQE